MTIDELHVKRPGFSFQRALWLPLVVMACSSARSGGGSSESPPSVGSVAIGPQPDFGELVEQTEAPPPISGGTLAASRTDGTAVAADPDRDRVYVVDVPARTLRHTIQLAPRSEPGRVALDAAGRAHVTLRGTGELATIDLATGAVTLRFACAAPRGVAFAPKGDLVYVACATGEVRAFPASGGGLVPEKSKSLGLDLRDVVVSNDRVIATRFRTARLVGVESVQYSAEGLPVDQSANLAWRSVAVPVDPAPGPTPFDAGPAPSGSTEAAESTAVVAQDPSEEPVRTEPGGYGSGSFGLGDCASVGIVSTRLVLLDPSGRQDAGRGGSVRLPAAVLPVDLATNGREFVVVAAGNAHTKELNQLFVVHREQLLAGRQECVGTVQGDVPGQAIAAAFDARDELLVQTREPAALHVMTEDRQRPFKTIVLATDSKEDTGHSIFHSNAGGNIACASCHAEGADDGRTWTFLELGPRRTPSLLGTTANTEPFHWSGDMKDLSSLVEHVFVERMSGPKLDKPHVDVLGRFLFTLPSPAKLRADVPARGEELFAKRCASCHAGPLLTNNQTVDVGTGGAFQVPSLVGVAWRPPYLHTGCAKTLFERFDPACSGPAHGDTRDLDKGQIADLVGYLESL